MKRPKRKVGKRPPTTRRLTGRNAAREMVSLALTCSIFTVANFALCQASSIGLTYRYTCVRIMTDYGTSSTGRLISPAFALSGKANPKKMDYLCLPRLFSVNFGDLSDKRSPLHIESGVQGPRLGMAIVSENFHHQSGVIGDNDSRLLHAQEAC